jgi:hypothetical protein
MRRSRIGTVRLLALMLPANLVWVFFACALECLGASDPACLEHERGEACCAAGPEAPCEAEELSDAHDDECTIVVERGVLGAGGQRQRMALLDATPAFFGGGGVGPGVESRRFAPLAHGPPRSRPLDRLPILRI